MKTFFFVISLMSFIMYKAENLDVNMRGTWQGRFGTVENMGDVKIVFGENNRIELFSSEIKGGGKATGFYRINDNKIIITCNLVDGDPVSLTMKGKINPKGNYIDGEWVSTGQSPVGFYLANLILN